jgi:uncharacterized membrane protein YfcA
MIDSRFGVGNGRLSVTETFCIFILGLLLGILSLAGVGGVICSITLYILAEPNDGNNYFRAIAISLSVMVVCGIWCSIVIRYLSKKDSE